MNIKKLESNFEGTGEVKGFEFRQIKRSDKFLLYEVYNGKNKHFEVFKVKTTPICLNFEFRLYSDTNFKEVYPKAKDFGIWAWTTKELINAVSIFDKLS